MEALQTPEGMVEFLTKNLKGHTDIIGAAFGAVGTGEQREEFLIEVALKNPEAFTQAVERVHELQDDEAEMSRYTRDRDAKIEQGKVARERQKLAQERYDRESGDLMAEATRTAKRLGIHKEDMGGVGDALLKAIDENTKATGSISMDARAARRLVKAEKKKIDARLERLAQRQTRRKAAGKRKAVKKTAARAKKKRVVPKRGAPGGSKRRAARAARKPPPGKDPLDVYVDHRLRTG